MSPPTAMTLPGRWRQVHELYTYKKSLCFTYKSSINTYLFFNGCQNVCGCGLWLHACGGWSILGGFGQPLLHHGSLLRSWHGTYGKINNLLYCILQNVLQLFAIFFAFNIKTKSDVKRYYLSGEMNRIYCVSACPTSFISSFPGLEHNRGWALSAGKTTWLYISVGCWDSSCHLLNKQNNQPRGEGKGAINVAAKKPPQISVRSRARVYVMADSPALTAEVYNYMMKALLFSGR